MSANSAPSLDTAESPALPSILQGAANPSGITIANLVVDGSISDADGVVESIAITALNTSLGAWQYSTDDGTTWLTIRADFINSTTNELGLLLSSTDKIRLLPFGNLNGSLSDAITFRAWDQSTGNHGDYFEITATGGNSSFSANSDTASVTVTAVNNEPSFLVGTGKKIVPVGSSGNVGQSVTIQNDGKIVVAGRSFNGSDFDFSLVRLNADGTLDNSFGSSGKTLIPVGSAYDYGNSVTIQSDGKIVVAGYSDNEGNGDFGLVRLNADGTLDNSFGGSGKALIPVGNANDNGSKGTIQSDGKIVVAGYSFNGSDIDFSLVRVNPDGTLDNSFGGSGKVLIPVGSSDDFAHSVAIQSDGKIVVAGYGYNGSDNEFILVRLNENGTADSSFGDNGKAFIPVGSSHDLAYSVVLQNDGKIVVAGTSYGGSNYDLSVVRLEADGTPDISFGGSGKVILPVGSADDQTRSVTIQSDGKIVVAVLNSNGSVRDFGLVRLNTDGTLDDGFGSNGIALIPVGSSYDEGYSVAIQSDGKIVVAGTSLNGAVYDFGIIRVNPDGTLDTSFNTTTTLDGTPSFTGAGSAVVLDDNVQIFDQELSTLNNFNGSSITLARHGGANATDLFGAASGMSFTGGNVIIGSTTIGTVSNSNGALTLTFNSNATQSLVNSALQKITYANSVYSASGSAQIDWTFNDGSSTGNATTAGNTVVTLIASANRAPTTSNHLSTMNEDTIYTFAASDFNFADLDTNDTLQSVLITRLPAAGSLKLNGNAVLLNQSISRADLNSGLLKFTPAANAWGTNYTDFGFKVNDGLDTSVNGATWSVNVNPVNDPATGEVTILGKASVGQTLTAASSITDYDYLGVLAYQWTIGSSTPRGARGPTYVISSADVGKTIKVTISFVDGNNFTESLTSATTAAVTNLNNPPTGVVTFTGTPAASAGSFPQGATLTATNTIADLDGIAPGAITYQWTANDISIEGATGSTFVLTQNQVKTTVRVYALYTDSQGNFEVVASTKMATVSNVNDLPSGSVIISDSTPQVGDILTVNAMISDIDGMPASSTYTYQWYVGGNPVYRIGQASSYQVRSADLGKTITVKVSYTDLMGTPEQMTSAATSAVTPKTLLVPPAPPLGGNELDQVLWSFVGDDHQNASAVQDVYANNVEHQDHGITTLGVTAWMHEMI